ncbi:MAG TPA: CPBP family intramembrane glutamic endopeptidase [Thermoanaerobaculia bacterium]|jgi:membrane protease YdiL (CAAX protease family)|nr:CPBP family intramembrane glutamic endopeptidase [Thermoanaerobaculia bacterium]
MTPETILRAAAVLVPSVLAALLLDWMCAQRRLLPPGFRVLWRRVLAGLAVATLLAIGVFAPLGGLGMKTSTPDLDKVTTPQLFLLHVLMLATMGIWFLLGFAGEDARPPAPALSAEPPPLPPIPMDEAGVMNTLVEPSPVPLEIAPPSPPLPPLGRQFRAQFGYLAPNVPREIGLGLLLGLGAWVAVLLALMVVAGAVWALYGENAVPKAPPAMIPFIAALPVLTRFMISLSAGFVEESFFRGFLQPRIGIFFSTMFFVLAHLSYGQPFMLIGIALLSLIYAFLVKWRQNLWPAIAAHALFDGVQLLVVVPLALRALGAGKVAAFLW